MTGNSAREKWTETTEVDVRLAVAQAVAREAGRLALSFLLDKSKLGIELKGPQDFVTSADRAVEKLVVERLSAAFPHDGFVAEEGHSSRSEGSVGCTWIIDPIDGTANFANGRSEWCVSIGLVRDDRPMLGVIYHATADQLFAAAVGRGATRDGAVIRASTCATVSDATIALEYSLKTPSPLHLAQVGAVLGAAGEYRRNGSAALSLAHVADGRLDGFVELHVYPWDVAAGLVLVAEAGGWTSAFPFEAGLAQPSRFIAGSVQLKTALLRLAELRPEQSRA